MHVNFQNVSHTFHHAIVMLLYLFCLGTNREEGTKVGQHSVLALPLAESLPNGVEASLPLLPSPSDPQQPYKGGRSALLGFSVSRHLTMGTFLPWVTGLEQMTVVGIE